jgi:hypothetical protein
MSSHAKKRGLTLASLKSLKHLSRKTIFALIISAIVVAIVVCAGIASSGLYSSNKPAVSAQSTGSKFSATQPPAAASRGTTRQALNNTSYVMVKINGESRPVFGDNFTTVKSVLEQGGITLSSTDTVTPSLSSTVGESTVITISSQDLSVTTTEQPLEFNTIKKQTSSLRKGQTKIETKGKNGVIETTNIVTTSNGKVVDTNPISSWVKTAPVNQVELVGTASTPVNYGTTAPVGQSQAIAHQQVLAHGWNEGQFTCLVQLWQRESGWRTNAGNASGAYGIPQSLPGSKMASAGADWRTNPATQIKWGLGYISGRYGNPCNAWAHSNSYGWY